MLDQEYMLEKMRESGNRELMRIEKRYQAGQEGRDSRSNSRKIKRPRMLAILLSIIGRNASR